MSVSKYAFVWQKSLGVLLGISGFTLPNYSFNKSLDCVYHRGLFSTFFIKRFPRLELKLKSSALFLKLLTDVKILFFSFLLLRELNVTCILTT